MLASGSGPRLHSMLITGIKLVANEKQNGPNVWEYSSSVIRSNNINTTTDVVLFHKSADLTVERQLDGESELGQRGLPPKGVSSKWSKTTTTTSETIIDGHETAPAQQLKGDESVDSRAEVQPRGGKSAAATDLDKTVSAKDKAETTTEGTLQLLTSGVTGGEYQQIVSSLMDMRVDLKLEIQRLNLKVSRIDEHLVELVKKMPRLPVKAEGERTSDGRSDSAYRREGGDHAKHTSSKVCKKEVAPSKKRGSKSKSWTSPPSPNDSAVRAMLENEIQQDSLPQ